MDKRKFESTEEERAFWGDKVMVKNKINRLSATMGTLIALILFVIIFLLLGYGVLWLIAQIKALWISLYIMEIL